MATKNFLANRLIGFISTNLRRKKNASSIESSSKSRGNDDEKEKENLNLQGAFQWTTRQPKGRKRPIDEAPMVVREMREYLTKRLKKENGEAEDARFVRCAEYFEAAEIAFIENERLRELLAKKNDGSETDDEDVPLEANATDEETKADDEQERDDAKTSTEREEKREASQPSALWNVIVHSDDIFKTYILPKLTERDVSFLYDVNPEASALIARCGLLWSVLVNKDDIWRAHIFPKLNGTDVKFLYQANPETRALIKRSDVFLEPKFKATEMSSISTLEWAFVRNKSKQSGEFIWYQKSTSFCHKLARTNKLELLKWAREEKGCVIWDVKTIYAAIKQGNVNMLKYCYENGCPTSSVMCERAAEEGHLHILKYLHEDAQVDWEGKSKSGSVAVAAARKGHLHILKYLAEKNYDITKPKACEEAAKNGRLECLKHLREVNNAPWDQSVGEHAAEKAHLHILKYLSEARYPYFKASACARAAENGHLECLKYLHEVLKLPWDHDTCKSAASKGWIHVLKYLWEHKYSDWSGWDPERGALTYAAGRGEVEAVRFLREIVEVPWTKNAGVWAVGGRHHHVIEYLHEKKYPHFSAKMCAAAADNDDLKGLKYLREVVKVPWDEETGNNAACGYNNKNHVFKYLVECKFPHFTSKACLGACEYGNIEALRCLLETLKVPIHRECVARARRECYNYLIRNGYEEHVDYDESGLWISR